MASFEQTEFDRLAFFKALLKRFWLISLFAAIAGGLTYAAIAVSPPLYKAKGRLLVEARTPHGSVEDREGAMSRLNSAALKSQVELLRSPAIAADIAAELPDADLTALVATSGLPLWRLYEKARAIAEPFLSSDQQSEASPSKKETLTERIQSGLSIQPIGESQLIEVSMGSSDPFLSAEIVNQAMKKFVELQRQGRHKMSASVLAWLQAEISSLEYDVALLDREIAMTKTEMARRESASADNSEVASGQVDPQVSDDHLAATLTALTSERGAQTRVMDQFAERYRGFVQQEGLVHASDQVRIVMRATVPGRLASPQSARTPILIGVVAFVLAFSVSVVRILITGRARRPANPIRMPTEAARTAHCDPVIDIGADKANVPSAFGLCDESPGIDALVEIMAQPSSRLTVFAGIGGTTGTEAIALSAARRLAHLGQRPIVLHVSALDEANQGGPGLTELLDGGVAFGDVILRDEASRVHTISPGDPMLDPPLRRLALVIGALSHTYDKVILTFADVSDWSTDHAKPDFAGIVGASDQDAAFFKDAYQDALDRGAKSALMVRHTMASKQGNLAEISVSQAA